MADENAAIAQKIIDDAAKIPASDVTSSITPLEPSPMANASTDPVKEAVEPSAIAETKPVSPLSTTEASVLDQVLDTSTTVVKPVEEKSTVTHQETHTSLPPKSKPKNPAIMIAGLLFFLGIFGVGAYFVAQPGNLADNRSSAKEVDDCPKRPCTKLKPDVQDPNYSQKNKDGDVKDRNGTVFNNKPDVNLNGGKTTKDAKCASGYYACEGGCCKIGAVKEKSGGGNTTASTTVATPTPAPVCSNIKVYKGTTQVAPATLLPGDAITIAVLGTGNPTQARFRVNGAQIAGDTDADPNWTITTTKTANNEYNVAYTIPTGVTTFLFEGETFAGGAWR